VLSLFAASDVCARKRACRVFFAGSCAHVLVAPNGCVREPSFCCSFGRHVGKCLSIVLLIQGYPGPPISFNFLNCPSCGTRRGGRIQAASAAAFHLCHEALERELEAPLKLRSVLRLAPLTRLWNVVCARHCSAQSWRAAPGAPSVPK
jgi:hypothetical protein